MNCDTNINTIYIIISHRNSLIY